MTKNEMIKIITETEKELYEQLSSATEMYGVTSEVAEMHRHQWSTVYRLAKKLEILN